MEKINIQLANALQKRQTMKQKRVFPIVAIISQGLHIVRII